MRRRAFLEYLDAVDDAVHAHRLDGGETGLLGVATCSFIIGRDGAFSDIELFSSSGHPELDNAALRAVQAASGRVQRPAIIGQEPIRSFSMSIPVRAALAYGKRPVCALETRDCL
jgi:TonB family protein